MKNQFYYRTQIGLVKITEIDSGISELSIEEEFVKSDYLNETTLIKDAIAQLREYLNGKRRVFDLPLAPVGTQFQKLVWNALLSIPYGEIMSYKEVAELIGRPKAYRAVGNANNKNPIIIVIPCHRVIGSDGSLTGYAAGVELKKTLLSLEKSHKYTNLI